MTKPPEKHEPESHEPDDSNKTLLQEMAEWKREVERRLRRLEVAVDVIQIRRQAGGSPGTQGA